MYSHIHGNRSITPYLIAIIIKIEHQIHGWIKYLKFLK